MSSVQTSVESVSSKDKGLIQILPNRTFSYIYETLFRSTDSWAFPALFVVASGSLCRMLINGFHLYVNSKT